MGNHIILLSLFWRFLVEAPGEWLFLACSCPHPEQVVREILGETLQRFRSRGSEKLLNLREPVHR